MKITIKILSLLFISLFVFTACSKDDDPADNDIFSGKYDGSVSYSSGSETKSNENGSVRVTKLGDNYSFNFSDDIPTLSNITMKKGDNNTIVIGDGALGVITISASNLTINYVKDGKTWRANAKR